MCRVSTYYNIDTGHRVSSYFLILVSQTLQHYSRQLLSALDHLHSRGIVHNDLRVRPHPHVHVLIRMHIVISNGDVFYIACVCILYCKKSTRQAFLFSLQPSLVFIDPEKGIKLGGFTMVKRYIILALSMPTKHYK